MKQLLSFRHTVLLGISLILTALFVFSACSDQSGEYPVVIANFTFDQQPTSVVCLNDSVADVLLTCGYCDRITVRSDECTQEELSHIPSAGTCSNPDIQKILDVHPDVVFSDKSLDAGIRSELERSHIKILNMAPASDIDELKQLYRNVCAVIDGKNQGRTHGEDAVNTVISTLDSMQNHISDDSLVEKTACYLYDLNGRAADDNTFAGKLFEYANVINVCSVPSTSGNIEKLRLSDPQYIFCALGLKEQLAENEELKHLTAVKTGHIFEINALEFQRQGESMTNVLSRIIDAVYPPISESSVPESKDTSLSESREESKEESSPSIKADHSLTIDEYTAYGKGDYDEDFKKVQQRLKDLGFYNDDITGYFGEISSKAFKAFEKANGLDQDGYASPQDLELLFSDKVKAAG